MKVAPEVLPPAFYLVGLNLSGRRCVVIGPRADREAAEKVRDLREVGADVVWLDDPTALRDQDLHGAFFVIATPLDAELAARLRGLADRERFLLCTIDQPAFGFVALPATVKAGAARIGISTGGTSPRAGSILRAGLQRALDARFARFLACLGHQRRRARARFPDDAAARRATLSAAADGFEVEVAVRYPDWFNEQLRAAGPHVVESPRG